MPQKEITGEGTGRLDARVVEMAAATATRVVKKCILVQGRFRYEIDYRYGVLE